MRTHSEAARLFVERMHALRGDREVEDGVWVDEDRSPVTIATLALSGLVPMSQLDDVISGICASADAWVETLARLGVEFEDGQQSERVAYAAHVAVTQEIVYALFLAEAKA